MRFDGYICDFCRRPIEKDKIHYMQIVDFGIGADDDDPFELELCDMCWESFWNAYIRGQMFHDHPNLPAVPAKYVGIGLYERSKKAKNETQVTEETDSDSSTSVAED